MSGSRLLWIGERLVEASSARLDPRDRGFTLGDGLFETMRAIGGELPLLPLHLARLRAAARVIGLPLPWSDAVLARAASQTLVANRLTDAALRLTVSRGVAARRGLLPHADPVPTLVIDAEPFDGYPAELHARGAAAQTSHIRRDERSPLAGLKSLGRLDMVLARRAAAQAGADEAIIGNTAGRIAGASAANLFVVTNGRLATPSLDEGALPGIVRGLLLAELAPALGVAADERGVQWDELRNAEEAFLTSALLGLVALARIDGEAIGSGRPGVVTASCAAALRRHLNAGG